MKSGNVDNDAKRAMKGTPSCRALSDKARRRITLAKIGCSGYFVRGPIPLDWIAVASLLPGKTLIVGLIIWLLSGINQSRKFKFEYKWSRSLGICRQTVYECFDRLEEVDLISAERRIGCAPVITLLASDSAVIQACASGAA